jgi:hypothetical protein
VKTFLHQLFSVLLITALLLSLAPRRGEGQAEGSNRTDLRRPELARLTPNLQAPEAALLPGRAVVVLPESRTPKSVPERDATRRLAFARLRANPPQAP